MADLQVKEQMFCFCSIAKIHLCWCFMACTDPVMQCQHIVPVLKTKVIIISEDILLSSCYTLGELTFINSHIVLIHVVFPDTVI